LYAFSISACAGWLTVLAIDLEFGYCLDLHRIAQSI
jgi:hypothetical protein